MQPVGYAPTDLTTSNGATLSAKAMPAFLQMYAAAAATGQPFYVTSSYRSYTTQISTYNHWIATSGQAGADTYSARPGYSEHQTGFAFDVAANGCTLDCFGSTSQYQWFQQHAADYGFIQRYYAGYESITGYKAEEWHYRYVGVEVAKDMQAKGVKTLEQYWNISGGDY
jgi:D-alanyl-D-alanine carboxypeptidase